MQPLQVETEPYAKCIAISKKVRWDIDKDVIRGREFDFSKEISPGLAFPKSTSWIFSTRMNSAS